MAQILVVEWPRLNLWNAQAKVSLSFNFAEEGELITVTENAIFEAAAEPI